MSSDRMRRNCWTESSKHDVTLEDLDRLTTGWLLRHISDSQSEFVSKLDGFAVLGADRTPLAVGGNLDQAQLETMLSEPKVKAAIAQSRR
jgi:hypothetical protein